MTEVAHLDWDAIAVDYAGRELSIAQLCTKHGIKPHTLYRRVRDMNWPRRSPASGGTLGQPPNAARTRKSLFYRLCNALDTKMNEFETRLAEAASLSPADSEREARTLHSLIRMFEKLAEIKPDTKARGRSAVAKTGDADADGLRQQLAQRLDRLRAGRSG